MGFWLASCQVFAQVLGMAELRFLTKGEQVALYLRGELENGRWPERMPGRMELAAELGLNARTVEEALRQLEREGVLVPQGAGKRRKIVLPESKIPKQLTIGFLMYEKEDRSLPYHVDLVHRLEDAGHRVWIAEQTLQDLHMDPTRVARVVQGTRGVDGWVVKAGSRDVLEWFVQEKKPVMAQFGRFLNLPVAAAGVHKIASMKKALRRLYELGHRRIVMIAREERRNPYPAAYEQAFLNEMEALGIPTGRYHLPEWENNMSSFHRCLDVLFLHTPPQAMFLSEAQLFVATQQHLARMGLIAPRDISLVCDDPDHAFSWCDPPISHIHWDSRPVVSRIIRWADRLARGVPDVRQRYTSAEFVEGGTIGPVPPERNR
jgi:DNA-binding LacI/PurR family transcriptional regulator